MRRITEEDLTLSDATGRRYPPRAVAVKLADTIIRTLLVVGVLYAIGAIWQLVH